MKIEKAMEDFISHSIYEKSLSPKTIKAYKIDLNQFQLFIKDEDIQNLQDIDKNILRKFLKHISNAKPKTIKRKITVIKIMFNYFEFEDIIMVNPFRKMKINIKETKELPKIADLKETKKLLSYLYKKKSSYDNREVPSYKALVRDIAIIEVLFSTGARVFEVCELPKKNMSFSKWSVVFFGKGSKERSIPIVHNEVKEILKEYANLFKDELENNDYFFINRINNKISDQSVRFMLKKHSMKANLKEVLTPHMFRHSLATTLLEKGVDIRYIQHILGHSSISTTEIYTKVSDKIQRKILLKHPRKNFIDE